MGEVLVGSIIGLAGAVIGAVVTHLLQRSHQRQALEIERTKVFSAQRLDAYVAFRRLAEVARDQARPGAKEVTQAARADVQAQLREAAIVIDSIGDANVVRAARALQEAFDAWEEARRHATIPHASLARDVFMAVREYVNAVRTSFGVDALNWDP